MGENELKYGQMPKAVLALVHVLTGKIRQSEIHLERVSWPVDDAQPIQTPLRVAISEANKINRASNDLRALLTAYAHRFHDPRPVLADLARAQDASAQGLQRRYTDATVSAIAEVLKETPDIDVVLSGFQSLSAGDVAHIRGGRIEIAKPSQSE